MVGGSRSVSLARVQLVLVIATVLGFIATTFIASLRARALDYQVDRIIGNSIPAVEHLSAARSDLHVLDRAVRLYVHHSEAGEPPTDDAIRSAQHSLGAALANYESLPASPREHEVARGIGEARAALDRRIRVALAATDRGDWPAAQLALSRESDASERADATIAHLIEFNAEEGRKTGLETVAWRRSTTETAALLDSAVALLALAAAVFAAFALRRAVAALEDASHEAEVRASVSEERSSELEQFAGRVAHDILSPLMAVGIGLQLSKAKLKGDPAATSVAERATGSLMRVRRIVEGLLAFARSGARPAGGETADLHEAVLGVLDDVRAEAEQQHVELVVEPFASRQVSCSPGVLFSLVGNLVRNAIKYMGASPTRRVTLRACDAGPRVRFEVEDTGPGIALGLQPTLFEPFVRAAPQGIPGSGLGLATVKRLTQAHHGCVGVDSDVGRGSTFWFELPAAPSSGRLEIGPSDVDRAAPALH